MTPRCILISLLYTIFFQPLFAQSISNINPTITLVNGLPFYFHTLLPNQSINDLAQAYFTSPEEIFAANPSFSDTNQVIETLLIPFNDASAEAMMLRGEELRQQQIPKPREIRKRNKEDRAIAEAAELLPSPSSPSEEEKQQLLALSQSLAEGLQELKAAEETIAETPFIGADGFPKQSPLLPAKKASLTIKSSSLIDLLTEQKVAFITDDSLAYMNALHLREYFLIRTSPLGHITNVKDERTLTNHNTTIIDINDLYGRKLGFNADQIEQQIIPIGLSLHLNRYHYPVKLTKRKKIKPLKPSTKETFLEIEGDHFRRMMNSLPATLDKGKYVVELVDGSLSLSLHASFEYNPFGRVAEEPFKSEVFEIIDWLPK